MEGKAGFLSTFLFLSAFLQHWQGKNLHPAILTLPKSMLWHKLMIKYFIFEIFYIWKYFIFERVSNITYLYNKYNLLGDRQDCY